MKPIHAALLVALAAAAVGCAKSVTFEGKSAYQILVEPPAPPPPPPADDKRVSLRNNQILIKEKIQFERSKSRILEVSFGILDEVADIIQKNPHIKKLQVEGHASAEGNAGVNQRLSQARATSVMQYLIGKGVAKERLIAEGFGASKPIADNETDEGREKNRRVEFNIVEQVDPSAKAN